MEQNSTKNMELYHLKDKSETITRADRQNVSYVSTPPDLFSEKLEPETEMNIFTGLTRLCKGLLWSREGV